MTHNYFLARWLLTMFFLLSPCESNATMCLVTKSLPDVKGVLDEHIQSQSTEIPTSSLLLLSLRSLCGATLFHSACVFDTIHVA